MGVIGKEQCVGGDVKIFAMFALFIVLIISGCTYYYGAAVKEDGTLYLTYAKGFIFYKNGVYRCRDEGENLICMDVRVGVETAKEVGARVIRQKKRRAERAEEEGIRRVIDEARKERLNEKRRLEEDARQQEIGEASRRQSICARFAQADTFGDSKTDSLEILRKCKKALSDPEKKDFVKCLTSADTTYQFQQCSSLLD